MAFIIGRLFGADRFKFVNGHQLAPQYLASGAHDGMMMLDITFEKTHSQ